MSLLFAGFKFLVRSCNDSLLHRDLDNAHAKSYKKTGKEINHARKKRKIYKQERSLPQQS